MFYFLSKLLKFFLFPLTWVLVPLTVAVFVKDKKHSNRRLVWFAVALFVFLVFSNKPLLDWARYRTTKAYIEQPLPERYYPVAVVMGGFGSMNTDVNQLNTVHDRGARIYEAVRLQRMGRVGKLLITGDATIHLDDEGHTTAPQFVEYLHSLDVPKGNILLEQHARNTRENAAFSIAMLDSLGYTERDCLLITSASHIKRSVGCFATEGWEVTPYATNVYQRPASLTLKHFLPSYQTLTDWQELLNEWFGIIAYKIVGY